MIALALDCSTEYLSIALIKNSAVVAYCQERVGNRHSEVLLEKINKLISEVELERSAIDQLLVGQGPGSFTGIRIALGVARGVVLGTGAQPLGQSSLHLIAAQAPKDGLVHVLVDARMQRCYNARFILENGSPTLIGEISEIEPGMVEVEAKAQLLGNGWSIFKHELPEVVNTDHAIVEVFPDVRAFTQFRLDGLNAGVEALKPIYVRNDVATPKKRLN